MYGGLFFVTRDLDAAVLSVSTVSQVWWLALVPPAWFVSYLELAAGVPNSTTVWRLAASIGVTVALLFIIRNKLGVDYARRLADLSNVDTSLQAPLRTPFFARDERRAVALLVVAHFKHDVRVRVGILAILPLMLVYVLLGSDERTMNFIPMAVLIFPAVLARHFASSETHEASWIYHATPANHGRLITAAKDIAVVYFLIPFVCVVAAVFAWQMRDWGRGVAHAALLGAISHVALQGDVLIRPRLPFALPPDRTSSTTSLVAWMALVLVGGQGALWALDQWVYPSPARIGITLGLLLLASWLLDRAIWRRTAYM
jgi:hypothetical protein